MKKKIWQALIAFSLITALVTTAPSTAVYAASSSTLSYGSYDGDVPDLQFRLKTLAYFNADVTSFFGEVTRYSVLLFQQDYGLTVDGIAGPETWAALKKASVNQHELDLLARIIYGEARGEIYEGQVAVGAVVMNRLASAHFPNSVQGVIEQPGAFTAVSDGQYNKVPDETAYRAALDAVAGYDPTDGALYYFNPETATSSWIWTRKQTGKIGHHIFAV
ncbi:cell wall hydrolase [Paenibacillus sp. HB172176]|uniref:cell wall hydrolase n=1 Tax=Paenibacillus sp. HB172176 TaxID=2493690 RepID=UPI001439F833|nr:cell wall hydrolase [Paenibacillus sp. HB172176]